MTEVWRPIPGYEGFYEASDHGRVRSIERRVWNRGGRKPCWKTLRGRLLKPSPSPRYLSVVLSRDGQTCQFLVHRLVLLAFVGPCPLGMECCHRDDDPNNNRLSNLRWDTTSGNKHDQVRNGTHANARKTHCKRDHEFTPENTYRTARGSRNCRTCTRERHAERKAA